MGHAGDKCCLITHLSAVSYLLCSLAAEERMNHSNFPLSVGELKGDSSAKALLPNCDQPENHIIYLR